MKNNKLIITPKTKIGELLDTFPQLENVLVEISPTFSKLKNPILRRTIAKVTSLQQAAIIGNVKVDEMLNRLRKEVGQDSFADDNVDATYLVDNLPVWFDKAKITISFDASPIINAGNSPMNEILTKIKKMQTGEIFELHSPFVPAPIIDVIQKMGFSSVSIRSNNSAIISYFIKR